MAIFQTSFTISRILQVFILQPIMGAFLLIISIMVLKRSRDRLSMIISSFFFSIFIGTIINIIYVFIPDEPTAIALHFATYFLFCFGQIFLLIFNLLLLNPKKEFKTIKHGIIIGVFALLLMGLLLIPDGININENTGYMPQWNLVFFLYAIILVFSYAIIPTIFTSFRIYQGIQEDVLKKRWRFYIIGIVVYYIEWFGVSISILLNIYMVRLIWNIFSLSIFFSMYFIYHGFSRIK